MDLLKKNEEFRWSEEATKSFQTLKSSLITTLVLVFPNFIIAFLIETDAHDFGIGVMLLQDEHLVAYYNKKLSPQW